MKNLNLKNVQIEWIDGSIVEKDLSKDIANLIYQQTGDIGILDIAMTLYKEGEVSIPDIQIPNIKNIIDSHVKAFVKKAIFKLLDN